MDERLLFVEDDPSIREITALGFERAGFKVTSESDGRRALDIALKGDFDGIVLDVMLPSLDGVDICREIRKVSMVPIVMLTARADTVDVVVGLEAGADDYVKKPFEMAELVARVRAVLRRAHAVSEDPKVTVGDLTIDPAGFSVYRGDDEVPLTATEFRLLLQLARRPGQVFTRELLLDQVWGYKHLGDSRLVDMAVKRLRDKIEDDPSEPQLIVTVRGVGYKIEAG